MKVTKNDNSGTYLFLPASGRFDDTHIKSVGIQGRYWSGTPYSPDTAYVLNFVEGDAYANDNSQRYYGFTVRPVRLVADTE